MRIRPARVRGVEVLLAQGLLLLAAATPTFAAPLTWIGGSVDWVDAGAATNWTPNDEPDSNDEAIFNSGNTVNLGSNNSANGLTLSGGIDLFTNEFDLTVDGLVQAAGSSTFLVIDDGAGSINADDVTINADGTIELRAGTLTLDEEVGTSLLDINLGGTLQGNGVISFADTPAATTTMLVNDGELVALARSEFILNPPPARTLQINAANANARVDLDGAGEAGVVNVNRNQTLDINVQLSDIFNGSMTMSQNTTLDVSTSWILGAGATVTIDNGAVGGLGGAPAGTSTIAGSSFAQNSGTITVLDIDGTLQFDAPFSMNGGTLTNNGHVIFNQTATIAAAANFDIVGDADFTVAANRTVTINQTNFNLDGSGAGGTVVTVNSGGRLNLNVTDYDSDSVTNGFDGTINVNSGTFNVTSGDAQFVMDGVMNMNKSGADVVEWEGETLQIGNDAGSLDADLNIIGSGNTLIHTQIDFRSDADVNIAANCGLILNLTANFNTVNGGNNAEFTGNGAVRFNSHANFNEAVTFNMTGGTVDFDGLDTFNGDTINVDAAVTVNAASMESFGKVNTGGVNTLDINNSVGLGALTVNLDNADAEWTLNSQGVILLVNDNTEATLLAGSDVNINGTVNVTGDVRTTSRLDIGSTAVINVGTAGQPLRLGGGNTGPDVNTISGGTVQGVGQIGADTGKALQGYGTINADITFVGTANLRASGGTLTIGGDIVDVNILGTADSTGILNVVNAWETDGGAGGSIGAVVLNGGVLQGGSITNDNVTGLQGNGTITARVINTSRIVATNGGTLILQTVGNNNDWDGAGNVGELEALSADLEMIDTTGPAPPVRTFGGTVRAINDNRVYANGFALNFLPGSSLELEDTATYRASSSTDIGGTLNVAAGSDATVQVANNFFLTFKNGSVTTLDGNVTLINNNINIDQGAVFNNGGGALKVPDGSHMVADNLADIDVLVEMNGAFRPGNFNGIGRVDMFDYQQGETGELYVEIIGTALNAFDRLVLSGDAVVDGYLNIDIDEISPGVPFVPALGQTYNIITGNSVTGQFDYYDVSGMPAGLAFSVNYLANAVQLVVVNKESFAADFDDDGDVDQTDYAIWKNAFNLNQLGDATGDNDSDAADYTVWRDQFGSVSDGIPGSGGIGLAAVPEPGTLALVLVGMVSGCYFRRRR